MISLVYLTLLSATAGGVGLVILWRRVRLFAQGERASGEFVRWQGNGRKLFHPIVTFEAQDGKRYEFWGPGSSSKARKKSYRVIYPPQQPEKAMVLSFWGFWAAPPVFLVFSAAAAVAAISKI